jgi:aspartyl/glutamyl-tRNA(Asn/Gln) amidotransferase C subunit
MTEQTITQETVKKIAKLCKLDVTGDEEKLAAMFNDTLKSIEVLNELDLASLPETYQVTGLTNVFQKEGEPTGTLSQDKALSNAKNTLNNLFVTQGVFDRE